MTETNEPLLTFDQALVLADELYGYPEPALLLGNGFSQAFDSKFGYSTLRKEATLGRLSNNVTKDALFDHAGTNDFETVIRMLEHAAQLHDLYDPLDEGLSGKLRTDAEVVKKGLVDTLAAIHPPSAAQVDSTKYANAHIFLRRFSVIYTLNYDMLLYWAVNQDSPHSTPIPRRDGFRQRDGNLTWASPGPSTQDVYYLHGAVHLYAEGTRTCKLSGSGGLIIQQVQENLVSGRYPLVVTEGTHDNKRARIAVSPYLSHCYSRLQQQDGVLFVHGVSLSENDQHILDAISDSNITDIFVGLFGDESIYRDVKHRAGGIALERKNRGGRELHVHFYQSESAQVWG